MPKGAMLSHRNLLAAVSNSGMGWSGGSPGPGTSLFPWPLCHVAGYSILLTHVGGSTLVLMRSYDPESFLQHIERHRCTTTSGAPTMLSMLLRHPAFGRYDLSTLENIGYGAAAMPAEVLKELMERLPGVQFATGFGMTELSGNIFSFGAEAHVEALANDRRC